MHSKEHQDLALRSAEEGIVLLKNEHDLLPLEKTLKTIAVIGPNADNAPNQLGDYSPLQVPQHVSTVLDGIKAKVSPATRVVYVKGCEVTGADKSSFEKAVEAARVAEFAVVVVGENTQFQPTRGTDGEGQDVASLDLTGVQEDLVRAVAATGTPVVLVLINGRPLSVRWEAAHLPVIVEAWNPGERGGEAVADVLFGDYNPSGRLAITIPRSVGQLPAYYNYKPSKSYWIEHGWTNEKGYADLLGSPLYPFGYGLSYTDFRYSNISIDPSQLGGSSDMRTHVRVDVENTGKRAGVETVQLYFHERFAPVSTPVKQLRGFERVALGPGEKKTVTFTLSHDDLMLLDQDMHWVVAPGTFDIMIGKSSADVALTGTLEVTAN
jgi:beta-glucosidase